MEVLKLSQVDISNQFGDLHKLKEIIDRLENAARAGGQVVCKIRVNGLLFSERDEERFSNTSVADISDIEVELEEVSVLMRESSRALLNYCQDLRSAVLITAEESRDGFDHRVHKRFTEIVSSIQWLTEALIVLRNSYRANGAHFGDGNHWTETEVQSVAAVRELMDAYKSRDFVRVSDVLEYEISTLLERWERYLQPAC